MPCQTDGRSLGRMFSSLPSGQKISGEGEVLNPVTHMAGTVNLLIDLGENRMRTAEKYKEMGFTELSDTKVQDRHGDIYYPRKVAKPLRAIKRFCGECMGMDRLQKTPQFPHDDIRNCTDPMCPLFDFRFGKNPFMQGLLSEEQKKAARERMLLVRKSVKTVEKYNQNRR